MHQISLIFTNLGISTLHSTAALTVATEADVTLDQHA